MVVLIVLIRLTVVRVLLVLLVLLEGARTRSKNDKASSKTEAKGEYKVDSPTASVVKASEGCVPGCDDGSVVKEKELLQRKRQSEHPRRLKEKPNGPIRLPDGLEISPSWLQVNPSSCEDIQDGRSQVRDGCDGDCDEDGHIDCDGGPGTVET